MERLYAFPREENATLRKALEGAGFGLLHVTYFFVKRPEGLDYPAPEGVRVEEGFPGAGVYRELYRESEESWALRLRWTDEELEEHFQDPAVHLLVAYLKGVPVGLAEVELEGGEASVAYIGVVPEARGKGIGRTLLSEAAKLARRKGADLLRVRAHDHEKGALDLYRGLGFSLRGGRGHLRQGAQGQAVGRRVGLHGEAGVAVVPPAHHHHEGRPEGLDEAEDPLVPPPHPFRA